MSKRRSRSRKSKRTRNAWLEDNNNQQTSTIAKAASKSQTNRSRSRQKNQKLKITEQFESRVEPTIHKNYEISSPNIHKKMYVPDRAPLSPVYLKNKQEEPLSS